MNLPSFRSYFLIPAALAACGLLSAWGASIGDADAADTTRAQRCRYQPSDDLGRCPKLTYRIVMSEDEHVCGTIENALNKAPSGERKLYSDPIFIPWRES